MHVIFFLFLFFIFITHFLWACGSSREPHKFYFQTLFLCIHALVYPITHSFLNGFQPNLSTSPMYALSVILFQPLECICERLLHWRLIVAITWTQQNPDTQSILMYHSVWGLVLWSFYKCLKAVLKMFQGCS